MAWVDGHARRAEPAAPPPGPAGGARRRRRRRRRRLAGSTEPATSSGRATSGSPGSATGSSSSTAGSTTACAPGSPIPALARYATWDDLAARLVDARAGALANRVRRLAGVVGARPDWHEVVLAELGVLHLLAEAGQRVPELPGPLADAVATACGWQVRQADVLAGVPDTDTWVVAGRSDTREDRIEVRRTWLHGERSGRWAMVLSFAAYRQSLDASLRVGGRLVADLHRYPGPSMRALVGTVHDEPTDAVVAPPAVSVADACDEHRRARSPPSRGPIGSPPRCWRRRRRPDGRWVLTDETGSLAIAPGRAGPRHAAGGVRRAAGRRSPSSGRSTASCRSPCTSPTGRSTSGRAPTRRS